MEKLSAYEKVKHTNHKDIGQLLKSTNLWFNFTFSSEGIEFTSDWRGILDELHSKSECTRTKNLLVLLLRPSPTSSSRTSDPRPPDQHPPEPHPPT